MPTQTLPIFVLTLEEDRARRQPLLDRLADLGLEHQLFFGVDGREGLPAEYETMVDRSARIERTRRSMTDGEYACALSHLLLCRQIVERGIPRAIVLEDDALVGTALAAFTRGELRIPGELVLLDHSNGSFLRRGRIRVASDRDAYRIAVAPHLTTGYALTVGAARHFLDRGLPVRQRADWPFEIHRMESYAVHPRMVDHVDPETGPSLLRDERRLARAAQAQGLPPTRESRLGPAYWLRWWRKRGHTRLDDSALLDAAPD
jgi:glycosyl transferase family 25